MATIRLTSKRQATLPKALCEQLGVAPGDELVVEVRTLDGEEVWVLRPVRALDGWVGSLAAWAGDRGHDWQEIEASIERGWSDDHGDDGP